MTILVAGATGNIGRYVVERLASAGHNVRALTRHPDTARLPGTVQVVKGDLARPATLPAVLKGAQAMYLFPIGEAAEEVVDLAVKAGVRRIVVLSSAAVTAGYDTDYHYPVEQAVERSGLEWTHLRPGEFALNSLYLWGPSIRAQRRVVDVYPDVPGTPIHEADIADVAAAALVESRHAGLAYNLAGPQTLTHRDQIDAIAFAIGSDICLEQVGPAEARAFYRQQGGWAADNADFIFGFDDYSGAPSNPETAQQAQGHQTDHGADDTGDTGNTDDAERRVMEQSWKEPDISWLTAADVTGRPARTYATWARDHACDFR